MNSITRVDLSHTETFMLYPHTLALCFTIRDCAPYLPAVYENIDKLRNACKRLHCVFVFDNCSDGSQRLLEQYRASRPDVLVIELHNPSPFRTVRIARARNACLDAVYNRLPPGIKHHMMIDADDKGAFVWNIQTIVKHLNNVHDDNWDCISFNRKDYYDAWALMFGSFKHHCWGFAPGHGFKISSIMTGAISQALRASTKPSVEVYSAFNGFAIYKTERFRGYRYDGLYKNCAPLLSDADRNETVRHLSQSHNFKTRLGLTRQCCEHLYYHLCARKDGRVIKISTETLET